MKKILIVGTGLFNAVLYQRLKQDKNNIITIIEKRNHIGGNCYTEKNNGITVHKYGAHIFHTSNEDIWKFANKFGAFNNYINQPIANYNGEIYNMPFNMNTFSKIFNVVYPEQAKQIIDNEIKFYKNNNSITTPKNLEEQTILMVGTTIFEKLVKYYTEKQWGTDCKNLPIEIIKRLPLRFTYDNNYFNDIFQGIPICGYTEWISNMFENIDIQYNTNFLNFSLEQIKQYDKIYYSGDISMLANNLGFVVKQLPYRSLEFVEVKHSKTQGCAVMNYTCNKNTYTRTIDHKYFNNEIVNDNESIISYEYPQLYDGTNEPYYPINNEDTKILYNNILTILPKNIIPTGRLGLYKYLDMDDTIIEALKINLQ